MAYLYILVKSTMHRYIIYIIDITIPYIETPFSTFLFSLSIPASNIMKVRYKAINEKSIILYIVNVSNLIPNKNANAINNVPDNISKMKYLGLIFSLQYLHFPLKAI